MSKFLTKLTVELVDSTANDKRGKWILTNSLVYESTLLNKTITVPSGFETDFSSVPRIPFVFDIMGDIAHEAAALHDWLYTDGTFARKVADKVLREAVIASGLTQWRATAMYLAVRMFGSSYYKGK